MAMGPKVMDGGEMAMVDRIDWRRGFDSGGRITPIREEISEPDQNNQRPLVQSRVTVDRSRNVRSGSPGAGGSTQPIRVPKDTFIFRALRRFSLWCYKRARGDIRDAREATATNPLIVAAVGQDKAREIAFRNYAPVMYPETTGNYAADELMRAVKGRERR